MFDLEATCRKLGIWEEPENEQRPVATVAIRATPEAIGYDSPEGSLQKGAIATEKSPSSHNRPTLVPKNQNPYLKDYKSELEAAKKLFTSNVPFTDQELAEHKINGLRLREDREFVRSKLKGIYGKKRLDLVNQYFDEWQKGSEAETNVNKIENTGRYRANTWLLNRHE